MNLASGVLTQIVVWRARPATHDAGTRVQGSCAPREAVSDANTRSRSSREPDTGFWSALTGRSMLLTLDPERTRDPGGLEVTT